MCSAVSCIRMCITDAIRDEKVLKFKVDYNDVRPRFKNLETEKDEIKLNAGRKSKAFASSGPDQRDFSIHPAEFQDKNP